MNFIRSALALALAGMLVAPVVLAGEAEDRANLSRQLLDRWSGHVEEAYQQPGDQWAGEMAPLLKVVPLADLRKAAASSNFDHMNNALLGKAGDGDSTEAFGDADRDLVFVPVAPCRIIDTRVAGGPIAANSTRDFDVTVTSSFAGQGGAANDCGVGSVGSFGAAVINFTVVGPGAAGYVTAFPLGVAQPLAATVNYTAGDIRGNLATVQLDQTSASAEMSVYSFAQTHLVADIVGYYTNTAAAVFECVETALAIEAVAAGATINVSAPVCAAGYTQTATNCRSSAWQMPIVFFASGTCSALNNGAGAAELRASRTCCRVRFP